ncbi:hypothetical protein ACS0PU_008709 [Formica fusca]
MYTNVPDTSIHIPSVRGGLPGVLSRSRRKDLLVLRSMKARESAQDDARKGRVWILGWTRNAKRRAEQGRPGQGAMSLRRVIPFLAIALTRDARVSVIFFKCQSSRKPSFEVRKDRYGAHI